MKPFVQPHASAWGYFHGRMNPKLTHGPELDAALPAANLFESVDAWT